MIKKNAMIYIVIGIGLTIAGILFTGYGTFIQNQETTAFQDTITNLSRQTSEKQDEISISSKKNIELAERLAEQSAQSNRELTQLSNKNAELTQELTDLSEDRFRRLTIPSMNVIRVEENSKLGLDSYFRIFAKNTGNNDCYDASLIIDKHDSPLVTISEIQNFTKVPKDAIVVYKIPLFQSELMKRIADEKMKIDFENKFLNKYKKDEMLFVFFHFEYKWANETLKSSQYSIIKMKNQNLYVSSNEEYISFEDNNLNGK